MALKRVDDDFQTDHVGEWTPAVVTEVRADSIVAYAAAVGETDPRLLSGEQAPLLYGVVPSWDLVSDTIKRTVPVAARGRLVHGEHIIRSARPLRAGDRLSSRARLVSVRPVSTGTVIVAEEESRDDDGRVLVHQFSTAFLLDVIAPEAVGTPPARPAVVHGDSAVVELPTDAGLPARYAAASGDHSPIHLDDDAARAIGLPGVILHGMCSLAIAARAVVAAADGDPTRLRAIACRFTDVGYPGTPLVTTVTGAGAERGFRVDDPDGRAILTSGWAELGAPDSEEVE